MVYLLEGAISFFRSGSIVAILRDMRVNPRPALA